MSKPVPICRTCKHMRYPTSHLTPRLSGLEFPRTWECSAAPRVEVDDSPDPLTGKQHKLTVYPTCAKMNGRGQCRRFELGQPSGLDFDVEAHSDARYDTMRRRQDRTLSSIYLAFALAVAALLTAALLTL